MLPKALCSILAIVALLVIAGTAGAAEPAGVTIASCKNDALTLVGKVALRGKDARKARGATLQMRFEALGLFSLPKTGAWKVIGRKTRASGQEVFSGLPAGSWVGLLSWRFKKGSKTVLSDDTRSQPLRIGSSKGQANCTLTEGLKPTDTTPPVLSIVPDDALWHRGPAQVQLSAVDDFSGVQGVRYSLDGGPITPIANRGSVEIAAEGAHTIAWAATDVAGNTAQRTATVRVDAAAPTKPVVQGPASVTASRTPTIRWSASTDSGSGMRGYAVTIQRADGSVLTTLTADANTTAVTAPTLDDGQNYTVTVTAVDNTTGQAWTTNSDPYAFHVDTTPNVDSVTPASGTIFSASTKPSFTLTLDRVADPATVNGSVKLHNVDSDSEPATTIGCANTPCTKITVAAQNNLPEGRYELTVNGLKSGDGENTAFQNFTAVYSVAFFESSSGTDISGVCLSSTKSASTTGTLLSSSGGESARVDFDWTAASGASWSAQGMSDGGAIGSPVAGGPGSGHATLTFPLPPSGTHSISVQFTTSCSGGNANALDTNNIVGARVP